jgi:hypothetical protein
MALVVVLAAGPAMASNTGFKLNYPLIGGGATNYLSMPYFYFPDGDVNNPDQVAEGICTDLATNAIDPCAPTIVGRLERVGPSTFAVLNHVCGTGFNNFPVVAGEMYYALTEADCTADIVGSHDDTYTDGKGSNMLTLLEGSNPLSIPYHITAVVAEDICTDMDRYGTGTLGLVTRVDVATGASLSHPCTTGLNNFDITPGEALFLTPTTSPIDVQWTTY